ncbi:MAG: ferredoxin [Spirochaetes bacterium]|nr:MAG: ferredoxin [Spirochaetota bacterium]
MKSYKIPDGDLLDAIETFVSVVDTDKCIGCGECVNLCPNECYLLEDKKSKLVKDYYCWGCLSCFYACPSQCIDIYQEYDNEGN